MKGYKKLDWYKWIKLPIGLNMKNRAYRMHCDLKVLRRCENEWADAGMGVYTRQYGVIIPREVADDIHSI